MVAIAGGAGLTACGGGTAGRIDYAVDGSLSTYNTNTLDGAASGGPQAFARVLTGFGYHGPDGQVIADTDFGSMSVVGREPLVLDYQISDKAVYSDGKPVTCDDMVLAWAAQSGRFQGFDAASHAGYLDIGSIDCAPGAKKAQVSFAPGRSVVDYTQLFTATSMMPSHVIADELGLGEGGVTTALQTNDADKVGQIARAWNTTWNLKQGIDPKHFPSSGPFKIDSVAGNGSVTLTANDRWWGAKPRADRITVWPRSVDLQDHVNDGTFDVVDVATGSSGTLTTPDAYTRRDTPSGGIEQLIFAPSGPLADPAARRAVALCTPRDLIARNAEVPIANARLHPAADDALSAAEGAAEGGRYSVANADAARAAIGNRPLSVRMGYQSPNARLATAVGAIATACAPAGITVSDAASDTTGPQSLRDGQIDVLLASTGGATGSGSTGSSALDAYALFTGNGDNLPGFSNAQIDGIISQLAVTVDPRDLARLTGEGSPVLWNDMPTLPLYRQQRTLLTLKKMNAVTPNPTRWGAGWNMDRWALGK
ncbi:MAG TPA: ABC transporter substrate-binding protein [Mycobacterium sp.]|nr:ABC transporter substrate-binding protein [Mycobacterium sp.]